jgi:hypothetical protein
MEVLSYTDGLDKQIEVLNEKYKTAKRVDTLSFNLSRYIISCVDHIIYVHDITDLQLLHTSISDEYRCIDSYNCYAVDDILIWSNGENVKLLQVFKDKVVQHEVHTIHKNVYISNYIGNGKFNICDVATCNDISYIVTLTKMTIGGTETKFMFTDSIEISSPSHRLSIIVTNTLVGEFIIYKANGELRISRGDGYKKISIDYMQVESGYDNTLKSCVKDYLNSLSVAKIFAISDFYLYRGIRSWFNGNECILVNICKSSRSLSRAMIVDETEYNRDELRNDTLRINLESMHIDVGCNLLYHTITFNDKYCLGRVDDDLAVREIGGGIRLFPGDFRLKHITTKPNVAYYLMNKQTNDGKLITVQINFS